MLNDMDVHAWVLVGLGVIGMFLGMYLHDPFIGGISAGMSSAACSIFLRLLSED